VTLTLAPTNSVSAHTESDLLLACARTAIDANASARIERLLEQDIDWEGLIAEAHRHGVVPLVYHTLQNRVAARVPADALEKLRAQYRSGAQQSMALTGALLQVMQSFADGGIQALPLKGPALAALAYGNLSLRSFCDLDILVRDRDVLAAKQILLALGYHPEKPMTNRQEQLHLQTHYVYAFVHRESHVIVELHYRIRPRYFAFALGAQQLWGQMVSVRVGREQVPSLAPEHLLLFLCAHGANHCWERLAWICDIAELLRSQPALDWPTLMERARAAGGERMLLLGLRLAQDLLGARLPPRIADRAQRDRIVSLLACQVRARLFAPAEQPLGLFESAFFHLRARERWRERIQYCLGVATITTAEDWALVALPAPLAFLYSLIRPFRLAGTYGAGLLKYIPAWRRG
jgi:hypothetical protein